jgi:hypothetical protein
MNGFLLIAPTGSGKSWVCKNHLFFKEFSVDGDRLIDWSRIDWNNTDWKSKDREHLEIVLDRMRESSTCVCWYVGTSALADALDEGRLSKDKLGIVLIPEDNHRRFVEQRNKGGHGWERAVEHRNLCNVLANTHGLPQFISFDHAVGYVRTALNHGT